MGAYKPPAGDGLQPLVDKLNDLQTQLLDLQRPSGTNLGNTAAQVQALVTKVNETLVNINATVTASIAANSYTKAVIDGKVANPPAGSAVTGNVSATGSVSAGGDLSGTNLYATAAPGYNITAARVAGWWESSTGRAGTAVSSRRFKTNIQDAGIDPLAVLSTRVKHYNYKAELARRDDPANPEYDPEYHVALEVGMIAEDLHDAGLWEFVIYEDDRKTPHGIRYELLALALLPVAQMQQTRLDDLEARLNAAGL